jgi:hypothetical protein
MGRKKLGRKPRTINVSDAAWQRALDLAAAETTDTHKGKPSHVIERLLLEAPDPKPSRPDPSAPPDASPPDPADQPQTSA